MKEQKINVLGAEWSLQIKTTDEDEFLEKVDGYCDKTSKKIVIAAEMKDNELECFAEYQKKVIRHEIIHAFLFESGLAENFKHEQFGHDETFVDWFAIQFPKIKKVFEEVNCI